MQDAVAAFAEEKLDEPEFLQTLLESLKDQNEDISEFLVAKKEGEKIFIIASLNTEEIGMEDETNWSVYRDFDGLLKRSSVILPTEVNDARHWRAYRGLVGEDGGTEGYILTDVSMERIDFLARKGIFRAWIFLSLIVVAIFFLLLRQARIIDYTMLYKKLTEVDQMKDDFISMAAHELRTPLSVIRGYTDILKNIQNLSEQNKEHLRRIDVSAQGLASLIGDILDVSRLEEGRMSFNMKAISPDETLSSVVESLRHLAQEKGLALRYEGASALAGMPKIVADEERLRQVMVNIIGNAVKYTKEGEVKVSVSLEQRRAAAVIIRVSDTGMGISAEDQKHLFEKFFRVKDKETSEIQGTGLGLWITRTIVQEMHGDIFVESIKGKGTDFIIRFPIAAKEP